MALQAEPHLAWNQAFSYPVWQPMPHRPPKTSMDTDLLGPLHPEKQVRKAPKKPPEWGKIQKTQPTPWELFMA